MIVFKLDRERPAFATHGNTLFYVRDKHVRAHDLTTGSDASVVSVRRLGTQYQQPRTLSYNPAEKAVIVTSAADTGLYELIRLPTKDGEIRDSATDGKRGSGTSSLFVARNRLAVLDKVAQSIEIRDLDNSITKTIKCPVQTVDIFFGGTASLLLSTPNSVVLFDIQQQKIVAELATPLVKYVVWSNDGNMVALLSKHSEFWTHSFSTFIRSRRDFRLVEQLSCSPTSNSVDRTLFTKLFESNQEHGMTLASSCTLL